MERISTDPVSSVSFKSLQNVRVVKADEGLKARVRNVVPPDRTPVTGEH